MRFTVRGRPIAVSKGATDLLAQGTNVIDGKRIEDNKIVAIKHFALSDAAAKHEVKMTRLASSLPGNENRCIPFVDALEDVDTDSLYLITEWAGPCNKPEFFNGLEIVDFVQQTLSVRRPPFLLRRLHTDRLQGLAFLHQNGIVHRYVRGPSSAGAAAGADSHLNAAICARRTYAWTRARSRPASRRTRCCRCTHSTAHL